jgi:phasin family protein
MFPFFPQQVSSFATANLHTLMKVTQRYASGLQQLAELNVQTVKTVVEESKSVASAGAGAKPGDFLSWQSTLFAELPEKAAAYSRHFFSIVRATEADILNEARNQYEQYGIGMKGMFEAAVQQGQSTTEHSTALLSNVAESSTQASTETAGVVLDASGEIAQTATNTVSDIADGTQDTAERAIRSAKAGSKR